MKAAFGLGSFNQRVKITVKVVQHTLIVQELFQKGADGRVFELARVWLQTLDFHDPHTRRCRSYVKGLLHNVLDR